MLKFDGYILVKSEMATHQKQTETADNKVISTQKPRIKTSETEAHSAELSETQRAFASTIQV